MTTLHLRNFGAVFLGAALGVLCHTSLADSEQLPNRESEDEDQDRILVEKYRDHLPELNCNNIVAVASYPGIFEEDNHELRLDGCNDALRRHVATPEHFWPAPAFGEGLAQYMDTVSKHASKFCKDVIAASQIEFPKDIEFACLLNRPIPGSLAGLAYSYFTENGMPEPLQFGSVCIDLPVKHSASGNIADFRGEFAARLPRNANWKEVRQELVKQGFRPSLYEIAPDALMWFPMAIGQELPLMPFVWIEVYEGKKELLPSQKWGCSLDEYCRKADLAEYNRLIPTEGLCFMFDGFGP